MASPALVWDVAIGQSTAVTQNVVANLFYRGLAFRRAPELGDTLRTRTEVVALRQNSVKAGRPATGLAALRITTTDQHDELVLDFWRCAMLPLRDGTVRTDCCDDMALVGVDPVEIADITAGWALSGLFPQRPELTEGQVVQVHGGDVVSCAPELARLTLNVASAHHDNSSSETGRLVYGGHTIGVALSQLARALPQVVTVLSWDHCQHLGPVREGDTLTSRIEVEQVWPAAAVRQGGRRVQLHCYVDARAAPVEPTRPVLDWRLVVLVA